MALTASFAGDAEIWRQLLLRFCRILQRGGNRLIAGIQGWTGTDRMPMSRAFWQYAGPMVPPRFRGEICESNFCLLLSTVDGGAILQVSPDHCTRTTDHMVGCGDGGKGGDTLPPSDYALQTLTSRRGRRHRGRRGSGARTRRNHRRRTMYRVRRSFAWASSSQVLQELQPEQHWLLTQCRRDLRHLRCRPRYGVVDHWDEATIVDAHLCPCVSDEEDQVGPRPASGGEATGNAVKIFSSSWGSAFPAGVQVGFCVCLVASACLHFYVCTFFLVFGALWRMSHAAWNKLQHALHGNGDSDVEAMVDAGEAQLTGARRERESPVEEVDGSTGSQPREAAQRVRRSSRVSVRPVDPGDVRSQLALAPSARRGIDSRSTSSVMLRVSSGGGTR